MTSRRIRTVAQRVINVRTDRVQFPDEPSLDYVGISIDAEHADALRFFTAADARALAAALVAAADYAERC